MAHYAPEFLAAVRHRYEKTDQPMIEMAREFGIGITTLQVMVDKQGWEKRSQRLRISTDSISGLLSRRTPVARAARRAGSAGTRSG